MGKVIFKSNEKKRNASGLVQGATLFEAIVLGVIGYIAMKQYLKSKGK